jgi:hypothetical protein
MLPNAAKAMRMAMRRKKRTRTWIDFSSCARFGSCAKAVNSFAYFADIDRRDGAGAGPVVAGRRIVTFAASSEIVAQHRFVKCACLARHNWDAGPVRRRAEPLGLDEGAEDRQRQIGVPALRRLIEPVG